MRPEQASSNEDSAMGHLFSGILAGHPIAISLAANLFRGASLTTLYERVQKTGMLQGLTQGTIGKENVNFGLKHSLELSFRLSSYPHIFKLFSLIGFFPAGLPKSDMNELWKNLFERASKSANSFCSSIPEYAPTDDGLDFLKRANLLIQEKGLLMLVPMVRSVAEEGETA